MERHDCDITTAGQGPCPARLLPTWLASCPALIHLHRDSDFIESLLCDDAAAFLERAVFELLEVRAHAPELVVAIGDECIAIDFDQLIQGFGQIAFESRCHLMVVTMGTSERFFDHVIDYA